MVLDALNKIGMVKTCADRPALNQLEQKYAEDTKSGKPKSQPLLCVLSDLLLLSSYFPCQNSFDRFQKQQTFTFQAS